MRIEVVYALPLDQQLVTLELPEGATVGDAMRCSGLLERYPEITGAALPVGIWGRLVSVDAMLRDQDRVEIYRALTADPKEVRRRRAARKT